MLLCAVCSLQFIWLFFSWWIYLTDSYETLLVFFGDINAWAFLELDFAPPLIWCLGWYYYASFCILVISSNILRAWHAGCLASCYLVLKWIWIWTFFIGWPGIGLFTSCWFFDQLLIYHTFFWDYIS